MQFLEPMQAAIISNHRKTRPAGLFGGSDGKPGRNILARADGRREFLDATAEISVMADDVLTIETPGGGGYGKPD